VANTFLTIDSKSSAQLKAVILALDGAEKVIQTQVRNNTKRMAQPEWQKALKKEAVTPLQNRVLASTGRVKVDNRGVTLAAGGLSRKVSGGFQSDPKMPRIIEFGANRNAVETYRSHSPKGKSHPVTRHTQRQLSWQDNKGTVVYPAATPLVGRFVSLWVQTTVRQIHMFFEVKSGG
jgi:hypothetical protein